MEKYANYTRCGEIFKSPVQSDRSPYILKCFTCSDVFLLLESFIFHIEDYCKPQDDTTAPTAVAEIKKETPNQEDEFNVEVLDESSIVDMNNDDKMETDVLCVKQKNICETLNDGTENDVDLIDRDSLVEVRNEPIADNDDVCMDEVDIYVSDVFDYDADDNDQSENKNVVSHDGVQELDEDTESADEDPLSTTKATHSGESNSTDFVRKFMESTKNVLTFINTYKRHPQLWNPKLHPQSDQHNHTYLDSFTKELNQKLRCNISIVNISQIISHLQRNFRNDLELIRNSSKNPEQNRQWYFEHLGFLRPFADSLPFDNVATLSPEQIIVIIKIYKTFPHLWDSRLAEYCCQNKRCESEMLMLRTIQYRLNLELTQTELQKLLRRFHGYCSKGKLQSFDKSTYTAVEGSNYYDHLKFLKDHVAPFSCPICHEQFKTALLMRAHISKHNGRNTLLCSVCNKGFKMLGPYVSHARRHMKDFQELCRICGKKFLTTGELEIHQAFHDKTYLYKCKMCESTFTNVNDLTEHKKTHEKRVLFKCRTCEIVFTTKDAVETHLRLHHSKSSSHTNLLCATCGKCFANAKALLIHELQHKGSNKFKCGKCEKILKTKYNYVQHMRTHGIRIIFKGEKDV